ILISWASIFLLPINNWAKLLAFILIALYGNYLIWHFVLLRSKHAIIHFKHHATGKWSLLTSNTTHEVTLSPDSLVTHAISILRFRRERKTHSKFNLDWLMPL